MKIAVLAIFYTGIFLSLWLLFEIVKYKQGAKIKAYFERQRDLYHSTRTYNKIQEENRLKAYKRSIPQLVEVEEVEDEERPLVWTVKYNEKKTLYICDIDITPKAALIKN